VGVFDNTESVVSGRVSHCIANRALVAEEGVSSADARNWL